MTGNKIVCSLVSITENWGIRFQLFAYGCLAVVCGTSSQTFGLNQYWSVYIIVSQSSSPTGIKRPNHFFYKTKLLKRFSASQNRTKLHLFKTKFIDMQSNLSPLQLERWKNCCWSVLRPLVPSWYYIEGIYQILFTYQKIYIYIQYIHVPCMYIFFISSLA